MARLCLSELRLKGLSEMKFYAACLAAYNNGYLHGVWIDATSDKDEMQAEINTMLAQSPIKDAEEWAIHDTDNLPSLIGEYSGLAPIAEFAELAEDFDDIDTETLIAIVDEYQSIDTAREALDDGFCGVYDSFNEYSDEYVDDCILIDVQSNSLIAQYFDYDAFARDLRHDMTVIDLKDGRVAVFHG